MATQSVDRLVGLLSSAKDPGNRQDLLFYKQSKGFLWQQNL
jgi:hypothetical protein